MNSTDRYEVQNDLLSEVTRTGQRKNVVVYKVWDKQVGQYIGTQFKTVKQVREFLLSLLQGE